MYVLSKPQHSVVWWGLKVLGGVILIGALVAQVIMDFNPSEIVPTLFAQVLVLSGGSLSLWHYSILKRANVDIGKPLKLECSNGLYRWVRHPMYLADMFTYTGLFLLSAHVSTALVLVVALFALFKQAIIEDATIRTQFNHAYIAWAERTKLIIPLIY